MNRKKITYYKITAELVEQIKKDQNIRREICKRSPEWFFHIYFSHYIKYPTADFQREMLQIMGNPELDLSVVVAFRGSGKSTILSTANAIWSIVGEPQKKFVALFGLTQPQASLSFANIRKELEGNELLIKDFGPFVSTNEEWSSSSLVIKKYNARIMTSSTGEAVRGSRFGSARPDLIICDDVEDLDSVKTDDSRDKTFNWFNGAIRPLGDANTKFILIGNLLHEDSLIMRLRRNIENDSSSSSIFREYPLITKDGECLWKAKYPDEASIKKLRLGLSDSAWNREYLLKIVPEGAQIIESGWLKTYDAFPTDNARYFYLFTLCSVDPAISERDSADYTAIVSARIYLDRNNDSLAVFIYPELINERLSFPNTVEKIKEMDIHFKENREHVCWVIEDAAYQRSLIQQLILSELRVGSLGKRGNKKERLIQSSSWIKQGQVRFPTYGVDLLRSQLLGFGAEKHDDLCDALTQLILFAIEQKENMMVSEGITVLDLPKVYKHSGYGDCERRLNGRFTEMVNGQIRHGRMW